MRRPIIEIDEEKCNGCGQCIIDCAEGALAIVNGKAKLISEIYCDGLGACLNCPQGALTLVTRDAPEFDEEAALAAKARREEKKAKAFAPLEPLMNAAKKAVQIREEQDLEQSLTSRLHTWPVQLRLMPDRADYLAGADILLGAHCAGFALPNLHTDWLAGRVPIIACPKLEDNEVLIEKLANLIANNDINSITALRMSVPCCNMEKIVREAIKRSGKDLPWQARAVKMR